MLETVVGPGTAICIALKELTFFDETGSDVGSAEKVSGIMLEGSELFIRQMIERREKTMTHHR
jgi:hypothetical protein